MSLTITANQSSGFEPIEAGTHRAICYGLVDLGKQYNELSGKLQHRIQIMFELPDELYTTKDGEEMPRTISKQYTASLNNKSTLYKDLIAWRGRAFSDDELKAFNLKNIVGAPCMLSVTHTEKGENVYANISGIMKMPKGMGAITPVNALMIFDVDESPLEMLDELPEWLANIIRKSEEYNERVAGAGYSEEEVTEGAAPAFTELDESAGVLPF